MGSPQEGAAAVDPPDLKATHPADEAAAASEAASPSPGIVAAYPDWAAYYTAGGIAPVTAAATAAFFPPGTAWTGQPMMPPYPYSPMYYAHPSITVPPNVPEGRPPEEKESGSAKKSKRAARGKSVTSGSAADDDEEEATDSGESGSEEGSYATGNDSEPQVGRKRTAKNAFTEGEAALGAAQYNSAASESSHGQRVRKLPVSAPGRTTLPGPAPNLNVAMELWNAPQVGAGAIKVALAPVMPGRKEVMQDHQWMKMDERELRRERRKQSNRESARRSRMRKQQECDELARRVTELVDENNVLKVEVERCKKDLEELGAENAFLMANLEKKSPDLLTEEEKAFLCRKNQSG